MRMSIKSRLELAEAESERGGSRSTVAAQVWQPFALLRFGLATLLVALLGFYLFINHGNQETAPAPVAEKDNLLDKLEEIVAVTNPSLEATPFTPPTPLLVASNNSPDPVFEIGPRPAKTRTVDFKNN